MQSKFDLQVLGEVIEFHATEPYCNVRLAYKH